MRKKVLIVNCHFDDERRTVYRPTTVLKPMGPVYLAGAFAPHAFDIRLYDEHTSGPLEDRALLSDLDMLVLTGLTNSFDRMLHLTAYARTLGPRVRVVAGGPAVRALPRLSARWFEFACTGDVEQMADVVADVFGRDHVAEDPLPRFDLAYWIRGFGHVESSRNCNYHCSFCSLTGERRAFRSYDLARVRREIEALGRRKFLVFIDNNFHGVRGRAFREKLDMVRELRDLGLFSGWGALLTSDFFFDEEQVAAARAAGCEAVYCGIESFDTERLVGYDKRQNTRLPPADVLRRSMEHGILCIYGLVVDPLARRLHEIQSEIELVLSTPGIGLPSMFTLTIPYPGTPFFQRCVAEERLLPCTRLRDLDGKTLCVRPLDPLPEVAEYVRGLQTLRGLRWRALRKTAAFLARNRRRLGARQATAVAARDAALIGAQRLMWTLAGSARARGRVRRTHVSSTEHLDPCYRPALPVAARFARHFEPTFLTDAAGRLCDDVAEDLARAPRAVTVLA